MKNFTVKASALAIAAALPGMASAVIDLEGALGTGATTYASELLPAAIASQTAVNLDGITATLGFGVAAGQDRYLRFDLTGAQWSSAGVQGADLEVDSDCATNVAISATETVVQGGAQNAASVIFQITADPTANGISASNSFCFDPGSVQLTSTSGASVKYQLYANPSDASLGGSQGRLGSAVTGTIAGSAPAFVYTVTPGTSTAEVSTSYKTFTGAIASNLAAIGTVTISVDNNVADLTNNNNISLASLVSAANLGVVGEDLSSTSNAGLFLGNANCAGVAAAAVAPYGATSRTIVSSTTVRTALPVCYTANGNVAIAEQDFTVALDLTAASNSVTIADVLAQPLGSFERNGTVLKAPYMVNAVGQYTFIQVANVSGVAAPWTIACFGESGALGNGAAGTLGAGKTAQIGYTGSGCAAGTKAIELIINAPVGNVVGTLVRQSLSGGSTGLDSLTGND